MHKNLFFGILILLLAIVSCAKDQIHEDYRSKFTGEFDFTVISSFSGPGGNGVDTNYYQGSIRKYNLKDTSLHFYLDDYSVNADSKIVVEISENLVLSSVIDDDGVLTEKSDNSFNQNGSFQGSNSVEIVRYVNPPATFDEATHYIFGIRQ